MTPDIMEAYIRQGDEMLELREQNLRLEEENESMRRTIDTILRLKCRRGEGAFALNIDLMECVHKNVTKAMAKCVHPDPNRARVADMVADFTVAVLVGPDRQDIPCAVLDTNTIVYKNDHLWVAATLSDFASLVSDILSEYIMEIKASAETLTDTQVIFFNYILQISPFTACMKKALKMYREL
jgi:hypothetical protein